jgi:DNA-binding CsgD family transcriptional regulator
MNQQYKLLQLSDAIAAICQPLFATTQINYFSHCVLEDDYKLTGAGTDPQLLDIYIKEKYYNYDIHNLKNVNTSQYIFWDLLPLAGKTKELYRIAQQMDFGHTFTIIKQTGNLKECFNFAGKIADEALNSLYLSYSGYLENFILYYKDKVNEDKLRSIYTENFSVEQEKSSYLLKNQSHSLIEQFPANKFVVNINQLVLSKREISCLYWLSQGKTLEEIAQLLYISHRTVKAHIKNAKEKLNCQTLFQLGQSYHQLELWRML